MILATSLHLDMRIKTFIIGVSSWKPKFKTRQKLRTPRHSETKEQETFGIKQHSLTHPPTQKLHTNKNDRNDITEILLNVALNTISLIQSIRQDGAFHMLFEHFLPLKLPLRYDWNIMYSGVNHEYPKSSLVHVWGQIIYIWNYFKANVYDN